MPADFVNEQLKDAGLLGAAVYTLLGFIGVLAGACGLQWKHANSVMKSRLTERDTLNSALSSTAAAVDKIADVTDERNKVTSELAETIEVMGGKFDRLNDRIQFQHDAIKDEVKGHGLVISAMSDATRNVVSALTNIQNLLTPPLPRVRRRK